MKYNRAWYLFDNFVPSLYITRNLYNITAVSIIWGKYFSDVRMLVYDIENMGSPNFDTKERDPETPTVVLIDNQATVSMAKSKKVTSKNRHIRRREHYVRQGQERGEHNLN